MASEHDTEVGKLDLLGGRLCLDFTNTVDWHRSDHPEEYLTSYTELAAWARHVGVLTEDQMRALLARAERRPADAAAVLQRSVVLREALYRLFHAIADHLESDTADLAIVNRELALAMARARVIPAVQGYAWDWPASDVTLDRMLWPVARSAAELLTSADLSRVRECAGPTCGWLFLDTTKNRTRRWCSMDACGNRAKAQRHYHRARQTGKTAR